jgi:hypothetical protein
MCKGIALSWLVDSPCCGAGRGAAGVAQCAKGRHGEDKGGIDKYGKVNAGKVL